MCGTAEIDMKSCSLGISGDHAGVRVLFDLKSSGRSHVAKLG